MTPETTEALAERVRAGIPPASMREEPHRALEALDALLARLEQVEQERDALRERRDFHYEDANRRGDELNRLRPRVQELEAALRAADDVFQWIGNKHKNVLVECPTELWRSLVACRLRLRGWEDIGSGCLMSPEEVHCFPYGHVALADTAEGR